MTKMSIVLAFGLGLLAATVAAGSAPRFSLINSQQSMLGTGDYYAQVLQDAASGHCYLIVSKRDNVAIGPEVPCTR